MRRLLTRRNMFDMLAGSLGVAAGTHRVYANGSSLATCYWRYDRAECFDDTSYERWCYRCCGPTGCEDAYCEWRPMESC